MNPTYIKKCNKYNKGIISNQWGKIDYSVDNFETSDIHLGKNKVDSKDRNVKLKNKF